MTLISHLHKILRQHSVLKSTDFFSPRKQKRKTEDNQTITKDNTNGKSQRQEFNEMINLKIEKTKIENEITSNKLRMNSKQLKTVRNREKF